MSGGFQNILAYRSWNAYLFGNAAAADDDGDDDDEEEDEEEK